MSIEINVPNIDADEVEIIDIMVKVGDKVNVKESLITVCSANELIEIPSPQAGIVKEIKVSVGDKVRTGKLIMVFDILNEDKTIINSNTALDATLNLDKTYSKDVYGKNLKLREVFVPDVGNDEFEVINVMVKIGDKISFEESLITIEGDKALMEVPAPFSGEVKEIKIVKGDKIKTGSLIMILEVDTNQEIGIDKTTTISKYHTSESPELSSVIKTNNISEIKNKFIKNNDSYVHATPLVRRLAHEFGVNIFKVNGTGRKGRILREDIEAYIKEAVKNYEVEEITSNRFLGMLSMPSSPKINFNKFSEVKEVELSRIQKISSANLSRNWIMIPHVTVMENADITELEAFRKQQNKEMEQLHPGLKITPLVFVMKAVAQALEAMPRFNSSISDDAQRLILKKDIHISIAVDTSNGLVVPVIRNVNKKGIIKLSKELIEVSKKARSYKLTASDMQGGSFTISSLGGIGTTNFTPIINAPEVAILGLSRSSIKPVWDGSKFISRMILPMSLSFDHRVIDGADGARFITYIAKLMSDIRRLVM